jgi:hypothetical protein
MSNPKELNKKQVEEVNGIIGEITKILKKDTDYEIAARDRSTLSTLLAANKIDKEIKSFKCKPEYSGTIVNHFVKEKGLLLNKFNLNQQSNICLIY